MRAALRRSRRAAVSAPSRSSGSVPRSRSATASGWTLTSTAGRTPTSPPSTVHPWSCGPTTETVRPLCLIGATTTATIDGQPGTYYFRSDDPALQNVPCAGQDPVSFTQNAAYIVVFPRRDGPGHAGGTERGP